MQITIESSTGYNFAGEIINMRRDGLVNALYASSLFPGAPLRFGVYLCRKFTRSAGRRREQRLEWLSFRDPAPTFATSEEAIAFATSERGE